MSEQRNIKDLETQMRSIGLSPEMIDAMKAERAKASGDHFYVQDKMEVNGIATDIRLTFTKWEPGLFELNVMDVMLEQRPVNIMDRNNFFLSKGDKLTVQEAVNLMQGRSVFRAPEREGDPSYWLKLSRERKFREAGIAAPEMATGKLDVAEWIGGSPVNKKLSGEEKEALVGAMHRGDYYALDTGHKKIFYVEANPGKGRLDLRDSDRKLISWTQVYPKQLHELARKRR